MAVKTFSMAQARPAIALDPRRFGRGRPRVLAVPRSDDWTIPDDVKLFLSTFVAGFLFVSIFIA